MHLMQKTVQHLTYPLWLWKEGDSRTLDYIRFYRRADWCRSEAVWRERQLANLRTVLVHAYEKTAYYNRLFRSVGFDPYGFRQAEQLEPLPILTKEEIRRNLNDLLAAGGNRGALYRDSTGGSTGEPLVFYRDRECLRKRKGQELFFDHWMGYEIGDKIALFVAARHYPAGMRGWKARIRNATRDRILAFDPYRTDEAYLEGFYRQLQAFRPKIIKCFPNSLTIFAQFLKRKRYGGIRPEVISCTGENLYPDQRRLFEEVFDCEVFEKYGCFEHGVLFCECREHAGLHTFTDGAYVEFLHEGRRAHAGDISDLVVTDLFNYGMPFIRYRIGDKVVPSERRCACGSALPLVDRILGRDRDILTASNGDPKPGYLFVEIINKLHLPGQFQFIQRSRSRLEIRVVPAGGFGDEQASLIREKCRGLLGTEMEIVFRVVETIPREPSGKYAYVKSEVSL